MNQIINDFGKGFKQLGEETAEKLVEETGKILDPTITAQELLGGIKPLSEQEMAQKKAEEEKKKRSQMADLRSQISGRNLESEVKEISDQKNKEEEEKEKMFLENLRRQREEERQRQENNGVELMGSKKHRKDKGGNKHKSQQPDQSQMSQTAEYKGKID
jgi:hypothetical protein